MKHYSVQEIKARIQRYCAYQERSHYEVRNKLYELGASSREVDDIITELITSNFLNEERYARAFAGGKFRMKKWGKMKIVQALEAQQLSKTCIRLGLSEISDEDYQDTLTEILSKKADMLDEDNLFVKRDKLSKYAIQKGFEPDLVWTAIKQLLPG
jgi:regulatory protein